MKTSQTESQKFSNALIVAGAMVLIGVVSRILPHAPNFSPIASMALFGGAFFTSKRMAFTIPFIAMLVSDALIGFHGGMWAVYSCFAITVLMGRWIASSPGVVRVATAAVGSSVLFFLVTNFSSWLTMYDHSLAGLVTCYSAAIPFFQNTLQGNCFFSAIAFGTAALMANRQQIQLPALLNLKTR